MIHLSEAATNWSMDCATDVNGRPLPGGIVLQNIRNDGHNFAKDVRLVGLWVEIETVDPSGQVVSTTQDRFPLSDPPFKVGTIQLLLPQATIHPNTGSTFQYLREADEALEFSTFFKDPQGGNCAGYGLKVDYAAHDFFSLFANCEQTGLQLSQIFLFSRYSNMPAHEPTGALNAARFFPMVTFELLPNPTVDKAKTYSRVNSIRFDYRMHLSIDRHYDSAKNVKLKQLGNSAGLFKDIDTQGLNVGKGIVHGIVGLTPGGTGPFTSGYTGAAFSAVEKPLVLEVIGRGLVKGFETYSTQIGQSQVSVRCWDNIHWWGTRAPGRPIISAPGAFHCAHMHWRWGAAAGHGPAGSEPQVTGSGWSKGPSGGAPLVKDKWGPLVDPGIWMQTIRLAVVQNDPALDPATPGIALADLTQGDWDTLFANRLKRTTPDEILAGADIVLWLSVEVHRESTLPAWTRVQNNPRHPKSPIHIQHPAVTYTMASKGTIFIHGMYFPHEKEVTGWLVGSTKPEYWPRSDKDIRNAKQWFRSP